VPERTPRPVNARAHDNLGDALMHLRRYTDAEAAYREAIRLDPDMACAHSDLGYLLQTTHRYLQAEEEYREALRLDPEDPVALSNLDEIMRARQAPGRRR
jgi:Flp pilus assembly protein TadD